MIFAYIMIAVLGGFVGYIVADSIKKERKINHLYEITARLTAKIAEIETKHEELMDAEDTAESRIAAKIEKRWDEGLQQMLAFNPFAQELESGGDR